MGLIRKKLKPYVKTWWNSTCLIIKSCDIYKIIMTQFFNIQPKNLKNPIFFLLNMIRKLTVF